MIEKIILPLGRCIVEHFETDIDKKSSIIYTPDAYRKNIRLVQIKNVSEDTRKFIPNIKNGDFCLLEKKDTGFQIFDTDDGKTYINVDVFCLLLNFGDDNTMEIELNQIQPTGDRILVRPIEALDKKSSIILTPDNTKRISWIGEVLAVGLGDWTRYQDNPKLIPMNSKIGMKVIYGEFSGIPVSINQEKLLVMQEREIIGLME